MRPLREAEWIEALTGIWQAGSGVIAGPGDDCAVTVAPPHGHTLVSKVDAIVEGVHFLTDDPAGQIGHKALGRVLSDFGAMGAVPQYAMVTVGVPFERFDLSWMKRCYTGMAKLAQTFGVGLIGGELTQSEALWINLTLQGYGKPRHLVYRSGAEAGDALYVTGRLGGSFPKRHLRFVPRLQEGQWLARFGVRAMMDLSDGLGADLPRLATASECSFSIEPESLPRNRGCTVDAAVNDGEDYELLFAVSPRREATLREQWPFAVPLTRVGELLPESLLPVTHGVECKGWDHCKVSSEPLD